MNHNNIIAKEAIVNEVYELANDNAAVIVFEYHGLSVAKITELRRLLHAEGSTMAIYKNSLVERAAEKLGKQELGEYLKGPNAFLFSKDVSSGAKVLTKFARFNDEVEIKGGLFEGRVVGADDVRTISKLPNRDGMISMFLSVLNAPIQKFAATVKAVAEK
ncbi:MAG: 50S ribosomal protein L10 [Bacilli bacterium]|nr:50S ribosomal protein L10 [Bacilli bacterium]